MTLSPKVTTVLSLVIDYLERTQDPSSPDPIYQALAETLHHDGYESPQWDNEEELWDDQDYNF